MMDDEKVDLNLIAALIRYIVLEEEVSFVFFLIFKSETFQFHIKDLKKFFLKCF